MLINQFFAPKFPGYKDQEENIYRFRSINFVYKVKYPLAIPYSRRIFKILPQLKLNLIHTQHPYVLGEVGAKIAKKFSIPLVYTFHTQFEQYAHYIPFLSKEIVKKIARDSVIKYAKKCNCIITPASSIKILLREYGITNKIEVLPNAINTGLFENINHLKIRHKYHISKEDKVLIYVGRMAIEKNLAFMMQAFKVIHQKVRHTRLLLAGEGPELEILKDLAKKLDLADKIIFTGRIEYSKIPYYYAAGDLFVITSTTEVKPLAILEAMASGLPVAGINAPGASDTITSGLDGVLTENNLEHFAGEVIKLLQNQEILKKMGEHAKHTAQKYSLHLVAKKLIGIYKSLV
ncbi:MAG: glycosyltransferase [Armatimonadetes bacterium]|nr:glycosyltransferase [Armatimonadota bacterium]